MQLYNVITLLFYLKYVNAKIIKLIKGWNKHVLSLMKRGVLQMFNLWNS